LFTKDKQLINKYKLIIVDAFTTTPLTGNPCAVVLNGEGLNTEQMQAIARETNLSETAFVFPSEKADVKVRYFIPRGEIPFAGHPTIATMFALAGKDRFSLTEPITYLTVEFNIGVLPVEIHVAHGQVQQVVMTQQAPSFLDTCPRESVAAGLGLEVDDLRKDVPCQVVSTGVPFLIVPGASLAVLKKIEMDRPRLRALCHELAVPAAYVFSLEGYDKTSDAHARFCDPNGTSEDPFTGSACGAMACYLVKQRLVNESTLVVEQGHIIGRPGKAK